jgi:undecaprenyl-diphosphatase
MFWGVMGRDPAGQRLFKSVMIAFVPAAGLGYLIRDWIDQHMFYVETVIFAQIAGALLMFYAEYWYGKNLLAGTRLERTELTGAGAIGVGLLQCAALVPGTSRSMMTIVGAYFGGLDPRRAAEFSFILGFVTLTAASIYKSLQSGAAMIQVFGWPHVILGAVVAAITAALCVQFLIHWLVRYGLAVFAWYRIVMAGVLWVYFYW